MPPTTTIRKISAQQTNSQAATARGLSSAAGFPTLGDVTANTDKVPDLGKTGIGQGETTAAK